MSLLQKLSLLICPEHADRTPINPDIKDRNVDQRKSPSFVSNASFAHPFHLASEAVTSISQALNALLADSFTLYFKTKNFHWHMSGPHFRDYHLLLDEQADQIFEMTDVVAERVRKIGGVTVRSAGEICRLARLRDNDDTFVEPTQMLVELLEDNRNLVSFMLTTHDLCDREGDIASASLLENWADEAERRSWFLFEASKLR